MKILVTGGLMDPRETRDHDLFDNLGEGTYAGSRSHVYLNQNAMPAYSEKSRKCVKGMKFKVHLIECPIEHCRCPRRVFDADFFERILEKEKGRRS